MYGREQDGKTYTFEPSGGLLNASLVMQDMETDSYWSIVTDAAIHGEATGQRLRQLPGSVKMTFGDWKKNHPETRVLSVEGKEHDPKSPYDRYFASTEGFRKLGAKDGRLPDKAPIFALHWRGKPHAIDHALFADGGAVIELGGRQIFLYREKDDSHYRSTIALLVTEFAGVEKTPGGWMFNTRSGRTVPFDVEQRTFGVPEAAMAPLPGYDTFWYIWSLNNPETELVTASKASPDEQEPKQQESQTAAEPAGEGS